MKNDSPLLAFVVGHSRGATTWMTKCLANHPDVAVFGETAYWGRSYLEPKLGGFYNPSQVDQILSRLKITGIVGNNVGEMKEITADNVSSLLDITFPRPLQKQTPKELFLRLCKMVAEAEGKKWVVEKTPHHLNHVDRIKKIFPTAKFVVMQREPYGFMQSYKNAPYRLDQISPREKRLRVQLYHPIGCAFVWKKYAQSARKLHASYPDSTCRINFYDVIHNPQTVVEQVFAFLGLPNTSGDAVPAVGTSFPKGKRIPSTSDDYFWMNFIAGREIAALGLNLDKPVLNMSHIVRSFFLIPLWVATVLYVMGHKVENRLFAYLANWLTKKH